MPTETSLKILVTGGRGFIGRRLIPALVARGADVTALIRTGHDRAQLEALGAQVTVAPLQDGKALDAALSGQNVVINFAYDVRAGKSDNLDAFEALFGAARRAGVRRVVHASSAVVYDQWPNAVLNENSPISTPDGGDYRQAKLAMENSLLESEFEAAILQPTIVYGPGSALWTEGPINTLRGGGVVLPDPCGTCAAVYVDDVVNAAVLAAHVTNLGRERFLISGKDSPSWEEFYQGYRRIIGAGSIETRPAGDLLAALPDPIGAVPPSRPSTAARISARLRRMMGTRRFEALISRIKSLRRTHMVVSPNRQMLELYSANPKISLEKAGRELGFVPQVDFVQGLAKIKAEL